MKQYQVPQFITVEDKVIGPFTIKQFLYLGGGALLIVGLYTFFKIYIVVPLGIAIAALSAALAFLKINEQPFPTVFKNAALYFFKPRLYIWKQEKPERRVQKSETPKAQPTIKSIPTISESKLSDLAWSLDIKKRGK